MKQEKMAAPTFRIKTYGRTELAQLYNPEVAPETAWRRLRTWIKKSPGMVENLLASGYKRGQRVFTPKQVCIIVDGVGEP